MLPASAHQVPVEATAFRLAFCLSGHGESMPKDQHPRQFSTGAFCEIAESPYSAGIQVLSGLYSDIAAAIFAVSGPRSF